jgi:poly(3-hydroxyalkanoate) depolymerase
VRTVDVGRQRLRVAIRRGGGGPPLLLCNGLGASFEQLDRFVAALPGVETITFDAPGAGGSPPPVMPYRFRGLARTVCRLLDLLGYGEVHVLGVSWGGGLAQELAYRYPGRVRRLVLVATSAGALMVPGRPAALGRLLTPRRWTDPAYRAHIAREVYGGDFRKHPEAVLEHVREAPLPSWRGYWYQIAAMAGWTSLPWLPCVTQPTLIVAGTDDPLVPLVNARMLAALIPRARLHAVDCGHLLLSTRTRQVAAVVQPFLEGGS